MRFYSMFGTLCKVVTTSFSFQNFVKWWLPPFLFKSLEGAGETVQWLRALATLLDDLNLDPSTHIGQLYKPPVTSALREFHTIFWLPQTPYTCGAHTHSWVSRKELCLSHKIKWKPWPSVTVAPFSQLTAFPPHSPTFQSIMMPSFSFYQLSNVHMADTSV